jgi:hypothetical protein
MNLGWDWKGWTAWMDCSNGQFSLDGEWKVVLNALAMLSGCLA